MPRTHGYSKKGERCYGTHDWGAKGRTNAIGGLLDNKLITVGLFDQSVNTEVFTCWVQQDLIPKLPPKSVIVMDNASFHKGVDMKKSIEDSGHELLYLPTYSPDLNPIEKKWAHAKNIRRSTSCSIEQIFNTYLM
jgi:transposase